MFGDSVGSLRPERTTIARTPPPAFDGTPVPTGRPTERLDVRHLAPPGPLRETLALLGSLDPETVLVQVNDRAPRHLYPTLEERGYTYETVSSDGRSLTVIWRPQP
jgi:uncharacterized protein (DUF2249 family)